MSKAFDQAWHAGLYFKLSWNGIPQNLTKFLHDFLHCQKQKEVVDGQYSS